MRKKFAVIFLLALGLIYFLKLPIVHATNFNNAYVRLDTLKANSPLSGTVCIQPSSSGAGIENKIIVKFPNQFTISSNNSDWSVNTTNLPTGATSWPGISINSISGKNVIFNSNDLVNNLYCFNFNADNSTTGTAGTDQAGTIVSQNNSGTTIDYVTFSQAIVSNDKINITATVDPKISDLPISLSADTVGSNFPQDTLLTYTINYGTNTVAPIPLTIQAEWTQGTVGSSPTPSVDIVEYVAGSATNAYGSTAPVINTVNRTITWTINSIPGGTTGQSVSFKLRTVANYTNELTSVSFNTLARSISGATVTPDESVTQTYKYVFTGNRGGPGDNLSDYKSDQQTDFGSSFPLLRLVSVKRVTSSEVDLYIETTSKTKKVFYYGASPDKLTNKITFEDFDFEKLISLNHLSPDTNYYFKIVATDVLNNTFKSDIYTFSTASLSPPLKVNIASIIATSSDNILLNLFGKVQDDNDSVGMINFDKLSTIIIPRQTVFTLQFSLGNKASLNTAQGILRKRVLGINSYTYANEKTAGTNYVNLTEVQPGVYTGKIESPQAIGDYDLYVRLVDLNGNILEERIAQLKVTNKFSIYKKGTQDPVENARVLLYIYNNTSKTYEIISPQILSIPNPIYSGNNGQYEFILPFGKYKAEISAIGYKSQSIEFNIDEKTNYPSVYLEESPLNIADIAVYYSEIISDTIQSASAKIQLLASSNRTFDILTLSSLLIFFWISIFSFSARTHVPVLYIPYFLIFKLKMLINRRHHAFVFGKIVDENFITVSKANVYLINEKNKIYAKLKTNKLGEFYFENKTKHKYEISIMKEGFTPSKFRGSYSTKEMMFQIKREESFIHKATHIFFVYFEEIFGTLMEFLVMLNFVFDIFFIYTFGFLRILPFLILSIISFILILVFIYKPKEEIS